MRVHVLIGAVAAWLAAMPAYAQNATWLLNPGSGDFNSAANWTPATVPTGTASFGTSNNTTLQFSAPTTVGGWTFNAGAYTFTNTGQPLEFNGAGIVVNGGSATINNNNGSTLSFFNTSTAGSASITNGPGGILTFNGTSTAANASITNRFFVIFNFNSTAGNATITNNGGGSVNFNNSSTAGSASITNNFNMNFNHNSTAGSATITNGVSGDLRFFDTSTAGNATITNNNTIFFFANSTAGNATITNTGGLLQFADNSTGGNATITNTGGALVDFSVSTGPAGDNKLTVGSIAGAGSFRLGANELTVGGNNLSTDVSGDIAGVGGSLVKVGTGTLTLSGTSSYTGATTVSAGTLRAGALNVFSPTSPFRVASGGTLDLNGFNLTLASVANAGLVSMGTGTAPGTLLTTPSYTGAGGTIRMNTVLGADNSPSDRLVINGGQASGNSLLRIVNAAGPGELTTGNGIRVVGAVGGGTTAPGAFALGGIVAAGAYEYRLFQGGVAPAAENDWFLRSSAPPGVTIPPDPTTPPGGTTPPSGTTPPQPSIPLFRPEAALYTLLPGMARLLGLETLGTFRERQGDQTLLLGPDSLPGAWGRVWGGHAEERRSGRLSPEFEGNLVGIQVGRDLFGWDRDGHRDRLGLFFGYARADIDARGFALAQQRALVGDLTMGSTSFGAYWTHLGPSKWYVDAVLMASWFDGSPRSTRGVGLNADGTSLTASLEAGYPIPIGAGWALEPQAQLIWQHVKFDQAQDPFATVRFAPDDALTGRIGARLFSDAAPGSTKLKPFLLANVWRTFSGSDTTTFNVTPITTDFGNNTSLELGGGVVAQLSPRVGVTAAASYITNLGGDHRQGVKGNIELRVTW